MEQPNVTVIPSHRKTISLTIEWDLQVVMRVPLGTTRAEVRNILEEKQAWLQYRQLDCWGDTGFQDFTYDGDRDGRPAGAGADQETGE